MKIGKMCSVDSEHNCSVTGNTIEKKELHLYVARYSLLSKEGVEVILDKIERIKNGEDDLNRETFKKCLVCKKQNKEKVPKENTIVLLDNNSDLCVHEDCIYKLQKGMRKRLEELERVIYKNISVRERNSKLKIKVRIKYYNLEEFESNLQNLEKISHSSGDCSLCQNENKEYKTMNMYLCKDCIDKIQENYERMKNNLKAEDTLLRI